MRADLDAVAFGEVTVARMMIEVRGMEAAGDIGDMDEGHQRLVIAETLDAEASPMSQLMRTIMHSPDHD